MERIKQSSYEFPDRVGDLKCKEKTKTQQHFAEEVDVNNIVDRALRTGILGDPAAIAARQARFGDFSGVGSYQDAMNRVVAAQQAFMELPARTREKFNNDPGMLIDYMASEFDDAKLREAVDLGLVPQKVLDDKIVADAKAAAKVTPSSATPASPA